MTAPQSDELEWNYVKLTHPDHHKKIVFRSVDPNRARDFIERRFPRGSEAYLQLADGSTHHHERERQGEMGVDGNAWQEFDPDAWVAPDTQAPPGETAWSDKEG